MRYQNQLTSRSLGVRHNYTQPVRLKAPGLFATIRINAAHEQAVFAEQQSFGKTRTAVVYFERPIQDHDIKTEKSDHRPGAGKIKRAPHHQTNRRYAANKDPKSKLR